MQSLHSSTLRASPLEPLRKSPNGTSRRSTSKKVSYISATVTPKISAPKREKDPKKRVVITGTGLASVFGNDVDTYYEKLLAGESGIGPIDSIRSLVMGLPLYTTPKLPAPILFSGENPLVADTSSGRVELKMRKKKK